MTRSIVGLRTLQTAFWCAFALTFVGAVMPARDAWQLVPWDKAGHFIAFYLLTALAAVGFPRARLIWVAVGLACFGAVIEIVQGLDFVGRDRDFWDWVADATAIAAAIAPMRLAAWRDRWTEGRNPGADEP